MHPYLIIFNRIAIPMYNLMIGVGTIFGFLVLDSEIKKRDISYSLELKYYTSLIFAGLAGVLGAKIFELIYHGQKITLANIFYGGFTFLGGVISAIIILSIFSLFFSFSFFEFLNILSPSLAIAHSFGRMGCFFAGCCYGIPTETFWGIKFPEFSLPVRELKTTLPIHPTQLYETVLELLLFLILIKAIKFKFRFASYLIIYGLFRFFIEFLRGDDRGTFIIKTLSPSQFISVIMVLFGTVIIVIIKEKNA